MEETCIIFYLKSYNKDIQLFSISLRLQTTIFLIMKLKTLLLACSIFLSFLFKSEYSQAQVPGGSCAMAVLIGGTGYIPACSGNALFTDFTTDGAVPSCISGTYRRDGWYKFINCDTQNVTITGHSTTASSNLILQLFSVCGGAEIGCANNIPATGAQTETLTLFLSPGTYYIKVTNYSSNIPANMTATICVSGSGPPCNDDCGGPAVLTPGNSCGNCTPTFGTLAAATPSGFPAVCGGTPNDDVWYMFTATSTTHVVNAYPCWSSDLVVQGYDNSCGTGTTIGCANAAGVGAAESLTLTGLTIGNPYWLRLYDFTGNSPCDSFTICIQTPPVNDDCANAIALTPTGICNPTTGCVTNATNSGITSCGSSNADDDVWYSFVACDTTTTIVLSPSASFDPSFEVFTGTCGTLTSILCNAPGGSPGVAISSTFATAIGQTYYIRAYDYGTGYPLTTNFSICVVSCSSVGIGDWNESDNNYTITPNPFSLQTVISFNKEKKNETLVIRNVLGKVVRTYTVNGRELTIERGELASGIYFITTGNINRKIVIE